MALLHFDGFETYGVIPTASGVTGVKVTTGLIANGWSGSFITTGVGLNIGRPAQTMDSNNRSWLTTLATAYRSVGPGIPWNTHIRSFPATGNTVVFGFKMAIKYNKFSTGDYQSLCRIGFGNHAFDVYIGIPGTPATSGYIGIGRITSATAATIQDQLGFTPTVVLGATSWNWNAANTVEVSINKTTGVVTVWINNSFVGTTTLAPTVPDYGCVLIFSEFGSTNSLWQQADSPLFVTDLYAVDDAGAAPTSRLGKVKVVTRLPTGDIQAQFTKPSGAPTNAAVAGQVPISASNYLTGVTAGDTDLYSSGSFSFSNESIVATAVVTSGYKTDAQGNNLQAALKLGGTVYTGPEIVLPVGSTYATKMSIFTTNPATGLKFTKAELDAANFGMRVKDPAA